MIGYDGLEWLKLLNPAPSTIFQHKYELGSAVATQLLRAFETGACESVRFKPLLVPGGTVGVAATS